MKLKYEISIIDIDGSPMAVPVGAEDNPHFVMHMNGITADILKILETDVLEEDIVSAIEKDYDATKDQIRSSVSKVVAILRKHGMLLE